MSEPKRRTRRRGRANVIYIIGAEESHLVKIGTTDDLKRRLREIQNMSPVRLRVIWQASGDEKTERALHRRFKEQREWGEWFSLDDPVASVERALKDPLLLVTPKRPAPFAYTPPAPRKVNLIKKPPRVESLPQRISGRPAEVHRMLRERIRSGEFPAGSALPVSSLWKEYGVPPITVTVAIKHLVAQGIVVWPHMRAPVVQQDREEAS